MSFFDPITSYDFHIYYNPETRSTAIKLKDKIFENFQKEIDSDQLIVKVLKSDLITGPHDLPFFEIDIESPLIFAKFFSFTQLNHSGLSILVHPNSGDVYKDHTIHTTFIGEGVGLKENILRGLTGYPDFGYPKRELIEHGYYNGESKGIMIRLLKAKDGFN